MDKRCLGGEGSRWRDDVREEDGEDGAVSVVTGVVSTELQGL